MLVSTQIEATELKLKNAERADQLEQLKFNHDRAIK